MEWQGVCIWHCWSCIMMFECGFSSNTSYWEMVSSAGMWVGASWITFICVRKYFAHNFSEKQRLWQISYGAQSMKVCDLWTLLYIGHINKLIAFVTSLLCIFYSVKFATSWCNGYLPWKIWNYSSVMVSAYMCVHIGYALLLCCKDLTRNL